MTISFTQEYLQNMYITGKDDKKHRFQPQIIRKYITVINLMKSQPNIQRLTQYGSLHYEHLHGDKEGLSSVKVNDQYRIEFEERLNEGDVIATICNITELSNHYK